MKTLREQIETMLAFERGEKIERIFITNYKGVVLDIVGGWIEDKNPVWNWEHFDYRVAKRKVKKQVKGWLNIYSHYTNFYYSKLEADRADIQNPEKRKVFVEVSGEYEVEE